MNNLKHLEERLAEQTGYDHAMYFRDDERVYDFSRYAPLLISLMPLYDCSCLQYINVMSGHYIQMNDVSRVVFSVDGINVPVPAGHALIEYIGQPGGETDMHTLSHMDFLKIVRGAVSEANQDMR